MATYTAVASVMQDLEEHLTSFETTFMSSELGLSPFTKMDVQNLYGAVSLMDSILSDSTGLSYKRQFANHTSLSKSIINVSLAVGTYIDYWAVQCLSGVRLSTEVIAKIGSHLTEMTKEIISITGELNKIQVLEVSSSSSTGKLNSFTTEHVGLLLVLPSLIFSNFIENILHN